MAAQAAPVHKARQDTAAFDLALANLLLSVALALSSHDRLARAGIIDLRAPRNALLLFDHSWRRKLLFGFHDPTGGPVLDHLFDGIFVFDHSRRGSLIRNGRRGALLIQIGPKKHSNGTAYDCAHRRRFFLVTNVEDEPRDVERLELPRERRRLAGTGHYHCAKQDDCAGRRETVQEHEITMVPDRSPDQVTSCWFMNR